MGVTTNACTIIDYVYPEPVAQKSPDSVWAQNAISADASGCEDVRAAPGTGKNLYVELLVIAAATNVTVTIGSGDTGTNAGVETTAIGPIPFPNDGGIVPFDFHNKPMKMETNKALTVDASGAGNVCIFAKGFTK